MTYLQILNLIKDAAKAQPNIHSIVREFTDLNREDAEYSAVVIQDRDGSRDVINSDDYVTYTWHLGYVDRLTEEKVDESDVCKYYSNRDDIYSTGMNVINNIVATLRKNYYPELDINIIDRFNTFNQRFTAECAGVYVVLAVNVQVSDCVDAPGDMYDSLSVSIGENGSYEYTPDDRPWNSVMISVDVSGTGKEEESLVETITSNGSYHFDPSAGKVFSSADIEVSVPSDAKPETICDQIIEENGSYHYTPTVGEVYRDVHITANVHPSVSLSETYTSNGSYNISGEFDGGVITVAVPSPRISSLIATSVTENGVVRFGSAEGEAWNYVEIPIDVHPDQQLIETIASNGVRNFTGEWSGATITVSVPTTVTVVMSQEAYNNLSVKDPNTIYLING